MLADQTKPGTDNHNGGSGNRGQKLADTNRAKTITMGDSGHRGQRLAYQTKPGTDNHNESCRNRDQKLADTNKAQTITMGATVSLATGGQH
jgi:hypothetical protein